MCVCLLVRETKKDREKGSTTEKECVCVCVYMCVPALLGFSATQAMVMPPISESLKRSRKVPLGLDSSMSWACCLFTKPMMALREESATPLLP